MNDRYRTDLFVQHLYKDQLGKLRFDPRKSGQREEFDAWKEQVREKSLRAHAVSRGCFMRNREVRFLFPDKGTATA